MENNGHNNQLDTGKMFKEAYVILNSLKKEDFNKIPNELKQLIKNKMDNNYTFRLARGGFKNQKIMPETKIFIEKIYEKYIKN